MHSFTYHRVSSLGEAEQLLLANPDAKLLAGGMSLMPMMKLRLAQASDIIDLGYLPELCGIEQVGDFLSIGAMTTHAVVAASALVKEKIPGISDLAGGIGDPHCRNRGTIGGSLAHSDPAACYPSAVLSLDGIIVTNRREIAADDFFVGAFETALGPGEIVIAVKLPIPEMAAYIKFIQPASRFSIVGVFASRNKGRARVAVTGAKLGVFRVAEIEKALENEFSPQAIDGIQVSDRDLASDIHARADYRAHLIPVLARRAVLSCLERKRRGGGNMSIHFDGFNN